MNDLIVWFAMSTSFASGAYSTWVVVTSSRPKRVECPNCQRLVLTARLSDHWKRCI